MRRDQTRNHDIAHEASAWISRIESGDTRCQQAFVEWLASDRARRYAVRRLIRISRAVRRLTRADWERVHAAIRTKTASGSE